MVFLRFEGEVGAFILFNEVKYFKLKFMAKIIFSDTGKEINVKDEGQIKDACEKLGVPFSCAEGICGTCMIDIVEGQENLSELTQEEKRHGHE